MSPHTIGPSRALVPDRARERRDHVLGLYSRHPISADQILGRLRESRGHLNHLRPEELFPLDQDHYGGLAANDALARRAGIRAGSLVADFCAGLGGPARYLTSRYGARVLCLEINATRVRGARDLTARVGLAERVLVIRADVMRVPLAARSLEAVMSQDALLHVPDKAAVLGEAFRVLRPGGRLIFTDWVQHRPLATEDAEILWRGPAAQSLQSEDGYRAPLERAGFRLESVEDLTAEWGPVLEQRFAMYRRLREENATAKLPAGDRDFYLTYERLVALVRQGALGGGCFAAVR